MTATQVQVRCWMHQMIPISELRTLDVRRLDALIVEWEQLGATPTDIWHLVMIDGNLTTAASVNARLRELVP